MLDYLILHQIYISCDLAVSKFRNPNIFLDFRLHRILGVRNLETQMCFRNFLLPIFRVSDFRKPKYFRPKFPFSVILSQLSIAKILGVRISETQMCFCNFLLPIFWVSEFQKPKCVFAILYYPYFGCPNFGNPNFGPNP